MHPIGYSAPCTGSDVLRPSHMNVEATAYVVVDYPSVLHHMCRVGPMPCCLYSASNMSLRCLWHPWFLVGWKLAPPACPGTTGRHDFDIRSRKQFLETVDLAREYKVPICRLANPVCRVCSSLQVKNNWVLPKQCKSGQGGLIKVPFWNNSGQYFPTVAGYRQGHLYVYSLYYHEAFWANQSRVPASLLNAFNAHLTTPCLLNVSPSTLRPQALLPRPNCRGFDWPRELVSPNSFHWLAVGMPFLGGKDLSAYKSF